MSVMMLCMGCDVRLQASAKSYREADRLVEAQAKAQGWETLPTGGRRRDPVLLCGDCLKEIRAKAREAIAVLAEGYAKDLDEGPWDDEGMAAGALGGAVAL